MVKINGKNRLSTDKPKQLLLWEKPSLDPTNRLKTAMRQALIECSLSREQVVDDINRLAGAEGIKASGNSKKITTNTIDKWVAPASPAHMIPIKYIAIFCEVTNSILPLIALAAPVNAHVITNDEAMLLEIAKIDKQVRELKKKQKRLSEYSA